MAMTPFEKALLGELKGIWKELSKLNKVDSDENKVKIPPPEDLLKMQLEDIVGQINQQSKKVEMNGRELTQDLTYDPLGSR